MTITAYAEFVKEEIEILPEFSEWFSQTHPAEDLNDYDDESLVGFYDEFLKSSWRRYAEVLFCD